MPDARLTLMADEPIGTISPLLHGHFAEHIGRCCNEGLWVGPDSSLPNIGGFRSDALAALKALGIPILRWPGGCYADSYHWRDGIGPLPSRPRTLGESCGLRVVEDNGLGTHEFIQLCRQIGAAPYLAGNLGSGSPQEMMDWVHYCNGELDTSLVRERAANGHPEPMNVRYWGVGNENWGCGGHYEPTDYAKEFRRFATFLRMADPTIELIACGHNTRDWNLKVVETLRHHLSYLDHLSVHQYYTAGPAAEFTESQYYQIMRAGALVEEDIRFTDEILRFFTAGRRFVGIAFDEWGVWHPEAALGCGYEAPNTLRDAVAAAGVLDVFHRWCHRVTMANLAQIINVLQCLIQTEGEAMWLTPTYHLFALYRAHRGAEALRVDLECPTVEAPALGTLWEAPHSAAPPLPLLSASASRKDGQVAVSLSNRHYNQPLEVAISVRGLRLGAGTLLTLTGDAPNAVNSVEAPERVRITETALSADGATFTFQVPPCAVQTAVLAAG
ncbi:MAG TPA: alpha-L-arabinofuranosidase C-terminal domain-containing protein [Chthonomonadaceae bacterium]|nr:alpha-L-arabinofuranosidase C-terminal domain-containing protein [Chthonomonadaceae bacterium]